MIPTFQHWFTENQLEKLYSQLPNVIKNKGLFINADHVGNEYQLIQTSWDNHREEMRRERRNEKAEDWDSFWSNFSKALCIDFDESDKRVIGGWNGGVEDGLPLKWHLDKLERHGFKFLDCFWRCDCDAIYGGIFNGG